MEINRSVLSLLDQVLAAALMACPLVIFWAIGNTRMPMDAIKSVFVK